MESVIINPCSTPDDSQRAVVPKARNSTNNFEVVVRDRQEGKNPFFFFFFFKNAASDFKKSVSARYTIALTVLGVLLAFASSS